MSSLHDSVAATSRFETFKQRSDKDAEEVVHRIKHANGDARVGGSHGARKIDEGSVVRDAYRLCEVTADARDPIVGLVIINLREDVRLAGVAPLIECARIKMRPVPCCGMRGIVADQGFVQDEVGISVKLVP